MMKAKDGFLLRKLGKEYMVVAIGEASETFNGLIRMNATGAFYWEEIVKGITIEDLVAKTVERYEGIDEAGAREDIETFMKKIEVAIDVI